MPLRLVLRALLAASLLAGALGVVPAAAADPSAAPSAGPAAEPTPSPDPAPTADPTAAPTGEPAVEPTAPPTVEPTAQPTADPSPGESPSADPGESPSATPSPSPAPVWTGRFNLYRSTAWVRQYRDYTCTAASAQTMLNLIKGRSDRGLLLQMRIIKYAKAHDYLRHSAGSDPAGWARALTAFGGGTYSWRVFATRGSALRYAAQRMRATSKPVGLLVWHGRHAWTMTGFTSRTDPLTDPGVIVTGVYVAPPLVGVDPRPNTYLTTRALGTFARYRERDGLRTWVGRWVVVAP